MTKVICKETMRPWYCSHRLNDDNIIAFARLVEWFITKRLPNLEQNLYLLLSISKHYNECSLVINRSINCTTSTGFDQIKMKPLHRTTTKIEQFFIDFFDRSLYSAIRWRLFASKILKSRKSVLFRNGRHANIKNNEKSVKIHLCLLEEF